MILKQRNHVDFHYYSKESNPCRALVNGAGCGGAWWDPFVALCYLLSFLVDDFPFFLHYFPHPFSVISEEMYYFEPFSNKIELISLFNIQCNPKDSSLLYIKTAVVCLHLCACLLDLEGYIWEYIKQLQDSRWNTAIIVCDQLEQCRSSRNCIFELSHLVSCLCLIQDCLKGNIKTAQSIPLKKIHLVCKEMKLFLSFSWQPEFILLSLVLTFSLFHLSLCLLIWNPVKL